LAWSNSPADMRGFSDTQAPLGSHPQVFHLGDLVAQDASAHGVHSQRVLPTDEEVEGHQTLVQQGRRRKMTVDGAGQSFDDREIRLDEIVQGSQAGVERGLVVMVHPVGVNGERFLVFDAQRYRGHRVSLELGQVQVAVVLFVGDERLVQATGDADRNVFTT
jgi:hypothetical protein